MSYNNIPTHRFEKELKRLAKKFPSLKNEFAELIAGITANPETGTFIGNNCYKIRLALVAKARAKVVGQGLSLICTLNRKQFISLPFTTKAKKLT